MPLIEDWLRAPAIVLSCPGPMRRQPASLLPLRSLRLPQMFLGGESQLLAFAAHYPAQADRFFFAPLPEMYAGAARLKDSLQGLGAPVSSLTELVHLRFGPVREARVLKGTRNAAVVAARETAAPLSPGHHPFATGFHLPASMRMVFAFPGATLRPAAFGSADRLPFAVLPCGASADLRGAAAPAGSGRDSVSGLDLISLERFDSVAWAARANPPDAELLRAVARAPAVLLPWNLAHFGGILPELVARLLAFRTAASPALHIILLPFNYLGQTGIIRDLIARLRAAAGGDGDALSTIYFARVASPAGLARLRNLASVAWVDGGDPEAWWTMARLNAGGFLPLHLGGQEPAEGMVFPVEDMLRVDAETRFGPLSFEAQLPARRQLRALIDRTLGLYPAPPARKGPRKAARR